ncbi:MAG: NfeD family protein [Solirubrobacteraceae bacterium]|nr:NfeD family protein [Solirubrobacteraceae bacterium]
MDSWIVWLLVAVGFGVAEVTTLTLFLAPFAAGAAVATGVAAVGAGTAAEIATFAVVTALSFLLLRPIAKRHLRQPSSTKTGAAALIGRTAVVLEPLAGPERTGRVRLDGEVWTARAAGLADVPAGETVTVLEIDGATAVVSD